MFSTDASYVNPPMAAVERRGSAAANPVRRLSEARVGQGGVIRRVGAGADLELERRLLEFGFVEGARIEVLHQGAFGGCPIAVRLDDMRVALRRKEAEAVSVLFDAPGTRI